MLREWKRKVSETVGMLWLRAQRLEREHKLHVDYIPGCIWSKPPREHVRDFLQAWEGPLGRVVNEAWTPAM